MSANLVAREALAEGENPQTTQRTAIAVLFLYNVIPFFGIT